jgi:hypothetical protein
MKQLYSVINHINTKPYKYSVAHFLFTLFQYMGLACFLWMPGRAQLQTPPEGREAQCTSGRRCCGMPSKQHDGLVGMFIGMLIWFILVLKYNIMSCV